MAEGVQDVAVGVMWPGPCRRMPVCCFEGRPRSQPYAQPGQFGREGGLRATDSRKGKKEQIRMTIAKQVRVLSFYPLLRPDDNSAKNLKSQAHLIPGNSSMNRGRNPFIYEAETGIVMDECIFAGKHKPQAPLFSGICNGLL